MPELPTASDVGFCPIAGLDGCVKRGAFLCAVCKAAGTEGLELQAV